MTFLICVFKKAITYYICRTYICYITKYFYPYIYWSFGSSYQ